MAGREIAAGIATWSAPSEARVFNRASHSASHRLRFHSFPYSYHRRNLFGHRSFFPYGSYCSVFGHHPFLPEFNYPIGQDLQLTIESRVEDSCRGMNGSAVGRGTDAKRD